MSQLTLKGHNLCCPEAASPGTKEVEGASFAGAVWYYGPAGVF